MSKITDEQIEQAMQVDITYLLHKLGYSVIENSNIATLKEHDSFKVFKNTNSFYWYSKNVGGNTINLVRELGGYDFVNAIHFINGTGLSNIPIRKAPTPKPIEEVRLVLPERNNNNEKIISYLSKRGLDVDIINHFLKKGEIYEDITYGNVNFIGRNKDGEIKYHFARGVQSDIKLDGKGSNKNFSFKQLGNNPKKVFVFEAHIDLLSHINFTKIADKDFQEDSRLSLGGLSDRALEQYLIDYPDTKEICLFLDNDVAGITAAKEIFNKYKNKYDIKIFTSLEKDLNETLMKYKKDVEIDKNASVKSYVKNIKEIIRSEKLLEHTKNILLDKDSIDVDRLALNGEYIERDNKAVITNGYVSYEMDIFSNNYKARLLESKKEHNILDFKHLSNNPECITISDSMLSTLLRKDIENVAFTLNINSATEIKKFLLENKHIKNVVIETNSEINKLAFENLSNKMNIDIKITTSKIHLNELIKDEFLECKQNKKIKEHFSEILREHYFKLYEKNVIGNKIYPLNELDIAITNNEETFVISDFYNNKNINDINKVMKTVQKKEICIVTNNIVEYQLYSMSGNSIYLPDNNLKELEMELLKENENISDVFVSTSLSISTRNELSKILEKLNIKEIEQPICIFKKSFLTEMKKGDREENKKLYSYLLKKTNLSKNKLDTMFRNGEIYQNDKNKTIFPVKTDGKVVGNYIVDIKNNQINLEKGSIDYDFKLKEFIEKEIFSNKEEKSLEKEQELENELEMF